MTMQWRGGKDFWERLPIPRVLVACQFSDKVMVISLGIGARPIEANGYESPAAIVLN